MENKDLNEQMTELVNGLTDEQKEKIKACKDLDELTALLGEMGVELPDELLNEVPGGYLHFGGGSTKERSLVNALLAPPTPEPVTFRPGN